MSNASVPIRLSPEAVAKLRMFMGKMLMDDPADPITMSHVVVTLVDLALEADDPEASSVDNHHMHPHLCRHAGARGEPIAVAACAGKCGGEWRQGPDGWYPTPGLRRWDA